MEDARSVTGLGLSKAKVLREAALMLFTFIICREPVMTGCFPVGISLIAYMLSRGASGILIMIPAAAGMILAVSGGYDPWGDLGAMLLCGLLLLLAGRMRLALWHRAVIAAAMTIVCVSIYRLATGTVYMLSIEMLLTESLVVMTMVFLFDAFFEAFFPMPAADREDKACRRDRKQCRQAAAEDLPRELIPVSAAVMILMLLSGLGAGCLIWLAIIFLGLAALMYMDTGTAFSVTAAGGAAAALMGQGQWGVMATVMMGLAAASMIKKRSIPAAVLVFAIACHALGKVESGVVLGVDSYSLLISSAAFLALHWKYGTRSAKVEGLSQMAAGSAAADRISTQVKIRSILQDKIDRMKELEELYGTYLDSRCILAHHFAVMSQILEEAKEQIGRKAGSAGQGRKASRHIREKLRVEVGIAQCAAAGIINGDCCGWQDMGDGRVVLMVSDGMGKGKKAAAESLMVTKTILCLLKAGVTADAAIKTINTIMMMKEDEDSYATVDLAIIDKKTAKARFYKVGAAPTLIRRKDAVEEISLSAVPLGTVNGLQIRYVETTLKKDDRIIMMTDGVSDGGRGTATQGAAFLDHIISAAESLRSADPQAMCDLLLDQAADSYIGRERDDMTVLTACIL